VHIVFIGGGGATVKSMLHAFHTHPGLCCGLLVLGFLVPAAQAEDRSQFLAQLGLPERTKQLLVVTAADWRTSKGALQQYARDGRAWKPVDIAFPVALGRNGMGWGRGRFSLDVQAAPEKLEGDGKSPAGIFELGDAFGYSPMPPQGCRLPYRMATSLDYFVDDPESKEYNSWIRLTPDDNFPQKRWKSFERMRLDSDAYELGIVVKHNMTPVVAGKGSAIFLHLRGGPDTTAGCTAMSRNNLVEALRWLDTSRRPLLVQVPETVLQAGKQKPVLRFQ
jgi:L,D-peptidoglycan transpeptidase YkuD (ErfK/YbiS/YcfS/YnhG family)